MTIYGHDLTKKLVDMADFVEYHKVTYVLVIYSPSESADGTESAALWNQNIII